MATPLIMLVETHDITATYVRLTGDQSPTPQLTLLNVSPGAANIDGRAAGTAWQVRVDNVRYNGLKQCLAAGNGVQVVLWVDGNPQVPTDLTFWNVALP